MLEAKEMDPCLWKKVEPGSKWRMKMVKENGQENKC